MNLRVKVYGLLAVLAIVGGGDTSIRQTRVVWISCAGKGPRGSKRQEARKEATPVELALVKRSEIAAFLSSTANLRALREVTVATQAEGIVQKVLGGGRRLRKRRPSAVLAG